MQRNLGTLDRSIRIGLAALFAVLIAMGEVTGTWAIILGTCAALLVMTALMGVCVLYRWFGFSTMKDTGKKADGDERYA